MKNKKMIIAAVALVAVIGILLGVYFATRPETVEGAKGYTVIVVHANGNEKTFNYRTDREYLADALLDEKLVQGDMTQYGLTIHTVDGELASWEQDQAYWSIYIGDEYALTGASEIPVTDGGVYKLIYTK